MMNSNMNETWSQEATDGSESKNLADQPEATDEEDHPKNSEDDSQIDEASHEKEIIETPNSHLADYRHPITDVPFERHILRSPDGIEREAVFPKFESVIDYNLPDELIRESDSKQFNHLNKELKKSIMENPELAKNFNDEQNAQIFNGDKPDGFTWHHHQEVGKMQLVDSVTHAKTSHEGKKHWDFQLESTQQASKK